MCPSCGAKMLSAYGKATGTGAQGYITFRDSANALKATVGIVSASNDNLFVRSDAGNANLFLEVNGSGRVLAYTTSTTATELLTVEAGSGASPAIWFRTGGNYRAQINWTNNEGMRQIVGTVGSDFRWIFATTTRGVWNGVDSTKAVLTLSNTQIVVTPTADVNRSTSNYTPDWRESNIARWTNNSSANTIDAGFSTMEDGGIYTLICSHGGGTTTTVTVTNTSGSPIEWMDGDTGTSKSLKSDTSGDKTVMIFMRDGSDLIGWISRHAT